MQNQETGLTVQGQPGAPAALVTASQSLFFDVAKFDHAQRVAKMLVTSTIVPEHFRNNIGNCLIALNYAERVKADPFMVMQNMYVVHGKPGLEGKLIIALVNQCGRFEPLEFIEDNKGCTAQAKEIKSGRTLTGPPVTWETVKGEGWLSKPGSKWKTMPQIMFRYRSAAFFARVYCPEVMLGMQTVEEINDFVDLKKTSTGAYEPEVEPAPETSVADEAKINNDFVELAVAIAEKLGKAPNDIKSELDEFVANSAKALDCPIDKFKKDAVAMRDAFMNAFIEYYKREHAEPENTPENANQEAEQTQPEDRPGGHPYQDAMDAEQKKQDGARLSTKHNADGETASPVMNWWDNRANWINKRGENFIHLMRLGFGLDTPRPHYPGDEVSDDEFAKGFAKVKKQFPDAVGTFRDGNPEITGEAKSKLLNVIGKEAYQAFAAEIKADPPAASNGAPAGNGVENQRQTMIAQIEQTFAMRKINNALFQMQRNPGEYPEDLAGVAKLFDDLMSGNGQ